MSQLKTFLKFHERVHLRYVNPLFEQMNEFDLRMRPLPQLNSIAWLVWHIARCEDAGVNRLAVGQTQVFDEGNWAERLNVPIRHIGTGMTDQEVAELSSQIDLGALQSYWNDVGVKTVAIVKELVPCQLAELPDPVHRQHVLDHEGMLGPNAGHLATAYDELSREDILVHFALTHSYGHFYEMLTIRSLIAGSQK